MSHRPRPISVFEVLERAKGFEPSTPTLARLCSTPQLRPLSVSDAERICAESTPPNSIIRLVVEDVAQPRPTLLRKHLQELYEFLVPAGENLSTHVARHRLCCLYIRLFDVHPTNYGTSSKRFLKRQHKGTRETGPARLAGLCTHWV